MVKKESAERGYMTSGEIKRKLDRVGDSASNPEEKRLAKIEYLENITSKKGRLLDRHTLTNVYETLDKLYASEAFSTRLKYYLGGSSSANKPELRYLSELAEKRAETAEDLARIPGVPEWSFLKKAKKLYGQADRLNKKISKNDVIEGEDHSERIQIINEHLRVRGKEASRSSSWKDDLLAKEEIYDNHQLDLKESMRVRDRKMGNLPEGFESDLSLKQLLALKKLFRNAQTDLGDALAKSPGSSPYDFIEVEYNFNVFCPEAYSGSLAQADFNKADFPAKYFLPSEVTQVGSVQAKYHYGDYGHQLAKNASKIKKIFLKKEDLQKLNIDPNKVIQDLNSFSRNIDAEVSRRRKNADGWSWDESSSGKCCKHCQTSLEIRAQDFGPFKKRDLISKVAAITGLIGGTFLLSSNITGNAIGNVSPSSGNIIGAVLLVAGLVAGLFYLRRR